MKMIINADDFGYSRGVNIGIVDAHRQGVLTSTTLMVTMPATLHAVELSKQNPDLGIGLHLNLSLGKPLTDCYSMLRDGEFIKPKYYDETCIFDENEVLNEMEAQYDLFIELMDCPPTHLDSHLFTTDLHETIAKCARMLANKKNIPLRNHSINNIQEVKFIQHRTFNAKPGLNYVKENIDEIVKNEYVEIMTHPAYIDSYLMKNSSYNLARLDELEMLIDEETKKILDDKNVELIHYGNIISIKGE